MDNARKTTALVVNVKIEDHLTKHVDIYDKTLAKHDKSLYGERGVNGLAGQLEAQTFCVQQISKRLDGIDDSMRWIVKLVLGAVILAVLGLVFVK